MNRNRLPMHPPRRKRLLLTTDTVGGVWTFTLELARALQPHGYEIHLAAMGGLLSPQQVADVANRPNLIVYPSVYRLEWMEECSSDLELAGNWLIGLEKLIRPHVVHLNQYCFGTLPWKQPVVMTAHSCVPSWWKAVKEAEIPEHWQEYQTRVQAGLQMAGRVVAVSKYYGEQLHQLYQLASRPMIIYNGLPASLFSRGPKTPAILAMGRIWDEGKNLGMLCRVAAEMPEWNIRIAGENRHPDHGREVILEGVHLCGQLSREEISEELSRAGIFVLPALYEPFGLSALEAAFSGCALVLSDIGTLREIWGANALFFNPKKPEDLLSCLRLLNEQPELRETLGQMAFQRAMHFSGEKMGAAYAGLYASMLEEREASRQKEGSSWQKKQS